MQLWQAPVPHHLGAAARIRQARKVRAAILWQKGWRRGKNQQILPPHPLNAASSAVGTDYESVCSLTNRFSAAHAGLTASAISPFECALRRNACGSDKFHPHHSGATVCAVDAAWASMRPLTNRFSAARARLTDSTIPPFGYSGACGTGRFHRSVIRVCQKDK